MSCPEVLAVATDEVIVTRARKLDTRVAARYRIAGEYDRPDVAGPTSTSSARWAEAGVTEALFGLPDRPADDVAAYVATLAARLGVPATP